MGTTRYARRKLRKASQARKARNQAVAGIPINAKTLRAFAMQWARYTHGAFIMAFERNPVSSRIKPDFLFLDKARRLVEVEIKCDLSDFKRDEHKKHRQRMLNNLGKGTPREVNYLWYLVPAKLVNYVLEHAPAFAGVLSPNQAQVDEFTGFPVLDVLRPAVRLHDNRLSTRLCAVFARDMAGTIASLVRDEVKHIVAHETLKDEFVSIGGVLSKRKRRKKVEVISSTASVEVDEDTDDVPMPRGSKAAKKVKNTKSTKTKVKKKKKSKEPEKQAKPAKKYTITVGEDEDDLPSKHHKKKKKRKTK